MNDSQNIPAVTHTVVIGLRTEAAFSRFVADMGAWWPRDYTWSKDALEEIAIEPQTGGRCFERGPHGFHCDWGRVLEWEAPKRLVFSWQISSTRVPVPDDRQASEVEMLFEREDESTTRVELEHRNFDRHGEGADAYQAAMASEQGWPFILECFVDPKSISES